MLQRLYVHNYRCLENFELRLGDLRSALLIGRNGSGKSTIGRVLEIFQSIGRGDNRVGRLVSPEDRTAQKAGPVRFEVDVLLRERTYHYVLALELPPQFKELRVLEERLIVDDETVYNREVAQVALGHGGQFLVDWHLVALSLIQTRSPEEPIAVFRDWLRSLLVLAPVPARMSGRTTEPSPSLDRSCENIGAVLAHLFAEHPPAWAPFHEQLKTAMPDATGIAMREEVVVAFQADPGQPTVDIPFHLLSDGERCFFLGALVLALSKFYNSQFCFWDEPDSFLALHEVGHFVFDLRHSLERTGSQILITSHREETIRKFGDSTTLLVHRANHLEPTQITSLAELKLKGDVVSALIRGDLPSGR